jgi:hypothetical protein
MRDVVTCDRCEAYTIYSKWSKEDLCPDCKKKEQTADLLNSTESGEHD